MATAIVPQAAVHDLLHDAVSRGSLQYLFLVRSRARGATITHRTPAPTAEGWVPSEALELQVLQAARCATTAGRTVLLAKPGGNAAAAADANTLLATPVHSPDGRVWGALVALDGNVGSYGQMIHFIECLAQQLTACELPGRRPSARVATPDRERGGAIDWSERVARRVLVHELRAPLAAARFSLEEVARRMTRTPVADQSELTALLRTAQLSVVEAQSLLRWSAQLDTIRRTPAQPRIEPTNLREIIGRALALLPTACVEVAIDEAVPLVAADQLWLTQILTNLIENALKHGAPLDQVRVSALRSSSEQVVVSVMDNGRSVSLEQQREIFRPYVRGSVSDDLTSQGLGLSIVRHFVKAMGGEIWMESDGSEGTTFSFTIPVAAGEGIRRLHEGGI